jgi:peptide/nickel transport system ATP-binding protein
MRLIRQLAETADEPLARAALDAVHLPEEATWAWPHMLSGGMAQRALAAMALLSGAPLLIADEPTKGLDPERVEIAIGLLRALRDRGRALLVITHDLRVARGLGGDVGVVRDGRIVERGEADSVLSRPLHGYTRAWLAADPANWSGRPARPAAAHVPVLRCEAVTFGYAPDRPLAREVSVTLHPGEIIGLSGPSGQGKTTLGNVLLGLHAPASGRVTWIDRTDPYADPIAARRWRRHYQKLHQDPVRAFAPFRTLGRQFSDLRPVLPPGALTDELPVLLERMRVRPALLERKPADVSGGEAQRLAIVRLLLLAPKVIVADEPDPSAGGGRAAGRACGRT